MIRIEGVKADFTREPLKAGFGFKGHSVDELWQTAVGLESGRTSSTGLATQSVLWSDAAVFTAHTPAGGNALMFLLTEYAAGLLPGFSFERPDEVLDFLLPRVLEYGRRISGLSGLRPTFALNALVAVDCAVWSLYARENGLRRFEELIPADVRSALGQRNDELAQVSLLTYDVGEAEIRRVVAQESRFLKIKIGNDPTHGHDAERMLEWDKARLRHIHSLVRDVENPDAKSGRVVYYLDANGRYPDRDTVMRLLDDADAAGLLPRILLLEEPFDEENPTDVHDLPVRVVADESVHGPEDVARRVELGYGAIALKPIAKTLTQSFRTLREAASRGIPCFCADLTVNPVLREWNKSFAARLSPLPGMNLGAFETNGGQNYRNWTDMERLSGFDGPFQAVRNGRYGTAHLFGDDAPDLFKESEYAARILRSGRADQKREGEVSP